MRGVALARIGHDAHHGFDDGGRAHADASRRLGAASTTYRRPSRLLSILAFRAIRRRGQMPAATRLAERVLAASVMATSLGRARRFRDAGGDMIVLGHAILATIFVSCRCFMSKISAPGGGDAQANGSAKRRHLSTSLAWRPRRIISARRERVAECAEIKTANAFALK